MNRRTYAGLLAAVVLLAGVVIVQATEPRGAPQGDPCPADVDNSGAVDVVDFLQMLGSWGPCPSVVPVDVAYLHEGGSYWDVYRLWSDGSMDHLNLPYNSEWVTVPTDPEAPVDASPVGVSGTVINMSAARVVVLWSDGTVRLMTVNAAGVYGWDCIPSSSCN